MGKYLKLFDTHSQYESYTADTSSFITPNVSVCKDQPTVVHYNPSSPVPPTPPDTRVVAKFNVTDTSRPTPISYYNEDYDDDDYYVTAGTSGFSSIEIDGVEQPSVVSAYTFGTTGEHTVKYTLKDLSIITNYAFFNCTSLTSITIPNSVASIGNNTFNGCASLTSVTIPDSVTSISKSAFSSCSRLTSIVVGGSNTTYDSRDNCNAVIETATNKLIVGCKNTVIPNNVTSIAEYAFNGCMGLTSVDIPNSVTSIGGYAFTNCI